VSVMAGSPVATDNCSSLLEASSTTSFVEASTEAAAAGAYSTKRYLDNSDFSNKIIRWNLPFKVLFVNI
jgi:hypothetical protein